MDSLPRKENFWSPIRNRVCCKLCLRGFLSVGNTINIWKYLKEAHLGEYFNAKLSGKGTLKSTDSTVDLTSNSNDISLSSTNKQMQIKRHLIAYSHSLQ